MKNITFIPKDILLYFYEQTIETYGGTFGIRDESLLDSALNQAKVTFENKYLNDSLMKMAASYGYHLCNDHPFIDGNKRIALVAMDVFLQYNGFEIIASEKEVYKMMIQLSSGNLSKKELTLWLEKNTAPVD